MSETLATVGGQPITRGDFLTMAAQRDGQDLMQALVLEKEVKNMADAKKVAVDEKEYQQEDARLKGRFTDPGRLMFEERALRTNLLVRALALADVPEASRKKFYDDFHDELVSYDMSQIVVGDEETAKQIESEVKSGSDFANLATSMSTDAATKESGGYLGTFTVGEIKRSYGQAAKMILALKTGDVSSPVRSQFGFHVFKVTAIKQNYDDLKPEIDRRLAESQQGELMEQMRAAVGEVTSQPIAPGIPIAPTAGASPSPVAAAPQTTEKGK